MFDSLSKINTVSASEARNNYSNIVKMSKESEKPVFVFNNNKPDSVILSIDLYEKLVSDYQPEQTKEIVNDISNMSIDEKFEIVKAMMFEEGIDLYGE